MPRLDDPYDEVRHGDLVAEKSVDTDCIEVYYVPSREQLSYAGLAGRGKTHGFEC